MNIEEFKRILREQGARGHFFDEFLIDGFNVLLELPKHLTQN